VNQSKSNKTKPSTLKEKLKIAFAVEQDNEILTSSIPMLDKAADFIVKRKLQSPATLALLSLIPLNFIGSQLVTVLGPYLDPFLSQEEQAKLIELLEHRDGIEYFIQRIELKANS
jgi:hypothetical protein